MLLDGVPLTDRIRFQLAEAPTAWRMWETAERLCGLPQASLPLHADGERLERPEQRQIPGHTSNHCTQGSPGRTPSQSLD